jgi:mRNA-degrading endonuclease RelE of RelBE toxin-antitoxin system
MLKILLSEKAEKDLDEMDNDTYIQFDRYFDKLCKSLSTRKRPGRHLKHGVPSPVENVGPGRIIYEVKGDTLIILRCFVNHKD